MTKEMINKIAKSYIDYAETIGDYYPDDIGQQDYMLSEFMRENVPDENRAEFWQVVKQIREAGNKMNTQITPDENKGEIEMNYTIKTPEYIQALDKAITELEGVEEYTKEMDWGDQDWYYGIEQDKQNRKLMTRFGVSFFEAQADIEKRWKQIKSNKQFISFQCLSTVYLYGRQVL